jgi:hypothetical protein
MQRQLVKILFPTLLSLFLVVITAPGWAQDLDSEQVNLAATAGFDGIYKGEFWIPVQVIVGNNGSPIEGQIQVVTDSGTGSAEVVNSSLVSLPTQSNKRLTFYVYARNIFSNLTVELLDNQGRTIRTVETNRVDRLAADDLLYGVVSNEPAELDFLDNIKGGRADAKVAFLTTSDLPAAPAVWNALDVVILSNINSSQLTEAQLNALRGWVSTGGQLVVTGGPGWQQTTAVLTDMLPVAIDGTNSTEDLPALVNHTGISFRDAGPYLVTTSALINGELLIHQDGLPLLARRDYGRGAVYFLALDPGLAPLVDWDGGEYIWSEIASFTPRLPVWAMGAQGSYAAGSAVSSLPALALPSAWALFLFLFLYIFVAGPLNYAILTRIDRRELAWLTIPALVLVFSAFALVTGFQLKGNETIINQMSVAFGHTEGDQLRVQSLLGLYSPRRTTYDLSLMAETVVRPFDRNFGNLSGSGNIGAIVRGNDVTVTDVLVDVSDVETLVAESYQKMPAVDGQAILRLDGSDFELALTVQNNSDVTLENATLLLGFTAISLGDLEPGEIASQTQTVSSSQAAIASGSGTGIGFSSLSSAPSASPLAANYDILLGTTNFYNDSEVYPRWQLLESISPEFGSTPGWFPRDTVTLIAWSEENQLEIDLNGDVFEASGTTLYFLELPLDQQAINGQNMTVPRLFLDWQVLGESGVYDPTINNLYLPQGWIEFEYQPWDEFRTMSVSELAVLVQPPSSNTSQPFPKLQLWDWAEGVWITIEDANWGKTVVSPADAFLGPGNLVRIRLQNDFSIGVDVSEVYPLITGDMS